MSLKSDQLEVGGSVVNESSRLIIKSHIKTMKKQRRGLNRYNILRDRWRSLVCQTNNTAENLKQKKIVSLAPVDQATDDKKLRSQPTEIIALSRDHHRV